jgi:hypothetical protein
VDQEKIHLRFEASAHLQRLIGRELIPNEESALIELVKNAYDAGAKHVYVTIQPQTEKEPGFVAVSDDGQGMTLNDFKKIFMFAGYSERPEQTDTQPRVPTGEKGIGRFATDKLGRYLGVWTKISGADHALKVTFDWEAFGNKRKKFNDITVEGEYVSADSSGQQGSGTRLHITGLRSLWTRESLLALRAALAELLDPFHLPSDFEIELQVIGSAQLSGPISHPEPAGADLELEFRVLRDKNVSRRIRIAPAASYQERETITCNVDCGPLIGLTARFMYFVKRPKAAQTNRMQPGVQIYRDGFRLEPFGSRNADWLGISERRAKRAGHAHIVPTRLFGFVEISRLHNSSLQDTTSRQALIESDEARALVSLLRGQVRYLEDKIRTEVSEPKWKAGAAKRAIDLERARLHSLGIMSYGLAHEIRQPLQSIRSEADNIGTRLRQLGISDSDIDESQQAIDQDITRIDENIGLISEIASGSLEDIATFDLAELVRKECRLFESRTSARGIDLEVDIPKESNATLNRTAVLTVLSNLLKNSIDAIQDTEDDRKGKVKVSLSEGPHGHLLEVTDNGTGISDDIRPKIFKRFASKKTGGLGIGLYYCNMIVRAHGGEITFDSRKGVGASFKVLIPDKPMEK